MVTERGARPQFRESSVIHYNNGLCLNDWSATVSVASSFSRQARTLALQSEKRSLVNLTQLQNTLRAELRASAGELFDVELDQVAGEVPPRTALGDLAFPVAFELAKLIKQKTGEKRAPRAIAEALKS